MTEWGGWRPDAVWLIAVWLIEVAGSSHLQDHAASGGVVGGSVVDIVAGHTRERSRGGRSGRCT